MAENNAGLGFHRGVNHHARRAKTRVNSDRRAAARVHCRKRRAFADDAEFADAIVYSRSQGVRQPILSDASLHGERALTDGRNDAIDFKWYEVRGAFSQSI